MRRGVPGKEALEEAIAEAFLESKSEIRQNWLDLRDRYPKAFGKSPAMDRKLAAAHAKTLTPIILNRLRSRRVSKAA